MIQINKIRIQNGDITTNTNEIQFIRKYSKSYIPSKLENLEEMDKVLDTYDLPKLTKNI
jgi:hypothetical protein